MRRILLLAAAVPILLAPPALAHDRSQRASSCPPPEITHRYDTERLSVNVRLRATGCPSREDRRFVLSAEITRFDGDGPTDRVERAVTCGPFPTMAELDRDDSEGYFLCDLDVALAHPKIETIHYDVDVAHPGEHSTRTTTLTLGCDSDGDSAFCE
ncbi:MAG: hypothetical protein LC792_01710 [Actinobacteria bacterium]|nr:hypothetical protein [Actinomycetota bacterium]